MTAEEQLPRPADGSPAGVGAAPTGKTPSKPELQAEVERTRAQLGATIDALSTRLSPSYQANRVKTASRTAAQDARSFLTGGGMPADDEGRARNVKVLIGASATMAALVALAVVRRVRR
ncbi:DUF3618 domain-containing protein [Xylanimonas sp. McL0601]|uniref:DUF3618 domain-containing protein n=1 Tax=Xylanimonas sp. McL0601 TaxID=3414739 RepID=UPI003CFA7E4C